MCLARRHLEFLEAANERDFRARKISDDTYLRFGDIATACRNCDRLDNRRHGDILPACRTRILRLFVSMTRDEEAYRLARRLGVSDESDGDDGELPDSAERLG